MAFVSVVIPVYNTYIPYFRQCMESLLNQTFGDFEAILVDDGSDNGVEKECDAYAQMDGRIRVIHQKNRGVSAARNVGTETACGEWLVYLDPDDWWEHNTLELLRGRLSSGEAEVLFFSFFVNEEKEKSQTEKRLFEGKAAGTYQDAAPELLENMQMGLMNENIRQVPGCFGSSWQYIIKRELAEQNGLRFRESLKLSEDALYTLYLLEDAKHVAIWDISLYHYRKYGESVCHRYNSRIVSNVREINKEFLHFIMSCGKGEAFLEAYRIWLMKEYLLTLRLDFFHKDNPKTMTERKREWKQMLLAETSMEQLRQTDINGLYESRKMYGILYFFTFRMPSFFMLRQLYQMFLRMKKI